MKDIAKIIRFSWSLKRYYLIIAALVIVTSLLSQITPFLLKAIVDTLAADRPGAIWQYLADALAEAVHAVGRASM